MKNKTVRRFLAALSVLTLLIGCVALGVSAESYHYEDSQGKHVGVTTLSNGGVDLVSNTDAPIFVFDSANPNNGTSNLLNCGTSGTFPNSAAEMPKGALELKFFSAEDFMGGWINVMFVQPDTEVTSPYGDGLMITLGDKIDENTQILKIRDYMGGAYPVGDAYTLVTYTWGTPLYFGYKFNEPFGGGLLKRHVIINQLADGTWVSQSSPYGHKFDISAQNKIAIAFERPSATVRARIVQDVYSDINKIVGTGLTGAGANVSYVSEGWRQVSVQHAGFSYHPAATYDVKMGASFFAANAESVTYPGTEIPVRKNAIELRLMESNGIAAWSALCPSTEGSKWLMISDLNTGTESTTLSARILDGGEIKHVNVPYIYGKSIFVWINHNPDINRWTMIVEQADGTFIEYNNDWHADPAGDQEAREISLVYTGGIADSGCAGWQTRINTYGADYTVNELASVDENLTVEYKDTLVGDKVTVTVPTDKEIKAGSLRVVNAAGEVVAVPERVGFQTENNASDKYTFEMPKGSVSVVAEYLDGTETEPNMGLVGWSKNDDLAGLRSIFRMPVYEVEGVYYTTGDVEIDEFGIIVGTAEDITTATTKVKKINFLQEAKRYDIADVYQDISVTVTGMDAYPDVVMKSCGYLVIDGVTYYTAVSEKTYA